MPPASTATSTSPGPAASGSRSSTRRSRAAWMTTARMGLSSDDGGDKRLAGEVRRQVVADQLAHRPAGLDGARAVVRLQHDIVERGEAGVDVRLVPEDVEPGVTLRRGFQLPISSRFVRFAVDPGNWP